MGIFSSLFGKKEPEAPAPPESEEDPAESLDSPDGAVRVDAVNELVGRWQQGDAKAAEIVAPRLSDLLDDSEPMVRAAALAGVRLLRKPENLQKCESAVLARLSDPVARVRTAAIWSAMRIGTETAQAQVRAALGSTDETMRFSAACALAEVHQSAALPELLAALREDHRRQEAISALMALGDSAALKELGELFEQESLGEFDRTQAAAALARFGDSRGKEHLVSRIEAQSDDRPIAAEWAGRLDVQDAIPALSELAEAEGDAARGAAIRALGRLKAPGVEDRLLQIAGDVEAPEDLRMDAAEGLAELGTPSALELLRKLAAEDGELGQLCKDLVAEVQPNAG